MKLSPERMREIVSTWRYFDADLALLFRDLPMTENIAVNCALYLQYLSRELAKNGTQDGWVEISNEEMRRKYLSFLTSEQIRKAYRALRNLGIISARARIHRKIHPSALIRWAKWVKTRRS